MLWLATPLLVLALALVPACGPSRVRWEPRVAAGEGAFTVVELSTQLRTRPDLRAPALSLGQGYGVLRVRRARAGWVELETLGEPGAAHCAPAPEGLAALRLVLYAQEDVLGAVTTRAVHQVFPDGTSIDLARGVPLTPLPQRGLFRAWLGDARVVVRLAASEVGTRYLPSTPAQAAPIGHLTPEALLAGTAVLGVTGRLEAERPRALPVHALERRGAEVIADLRSSCGVLRVRAPSTAIHEGTLDMLGFEEPRPEEPHAEASDPAASSPPPARLDEVPLPPPPGAPAPALAPAPPPPTASVETADAPVLAVARAGAPLRWPDGRAAGVVVRAQPLHEERPGREGGGRCFALAPEPGAPPIPLCFDAADLGDPRAGVGARLADPR